MVFALIVSAALASAAQPATTSSSGLQVEKSLEPASEVLPKDASSSHTCGYIRAFIFRRNDHHAPKFEREVTCVPLTRQKLKKADGKVHLEPLDIR